MNLPPHLVLPPYRLDPNSQAFKDIVNFVIGGSIKDENKPEKKADEDLESKSQGTKDEVLENRPDKKHKIIGGQHCWLSGAHTLDFYARRYRAQNARRFTDCYKFTHGEKICIHPNGRPIVCVSDMCFKSSWVGVHGMQSMCIVTRRDMERLLFHFSLSSYCEQDMTCLPAFYQRDCMKQQNMEMFAEATISEVECLPHEDVDYYDVAFRRLCAGTVKKPFAVVSPGQGAHEEFCSEGSIPPQLRVIRTNNYLESVVSSDLLHTHYGIIRVAIKAYQLLCPKELRADDLWVTIREDGEPNCFNHLPIDVIGEQLDLVNGLSSEKDPQEPLILKYRGCLQ